ncbi:MAG: NUDIX domain-containing protein, partial [Candidatus Blackburnbacteria bacterium]|nr:NUDIX domain-containing protein [Candidatus Blackburnbacteria bacterium]
KGTSIEEALKREDEEETGIATIKEVKPYSMVLSNIRLPTNDGSVGLILSSYLCEVENVENIKLSNEHIEYKWFSPQEAAKLLEFKYPREFVEKFGELK